MQTLEEIVDEPLIQAREEIERAAMIEALIESDLRDIERGSDLLRQILMWGFDGYEHTDTITLRDEMKIRGLEL